MTETRTREALLDAAEHVFARDGFAGASLREIMRDAGTNPAAAHYHFGGKNGLLEAVLDRVIDPITKRRLELLDRLRARAGDAPVPVRDLVEAFLRPDFEAIERLQSRGPARARLVGHAYGQPNEVVSGIIARQFDPVGSVYLPEFFRTLPDLSPEVLQWRLRWCVVGVIVMLFSNADEPDGPVDRNDRDASLRRAVDFVTAGLEAPAT